MKQSASRLRLLNQRRPVIGCICASLVAFGCGSSGEEEPSRATAPEAPQAPEEVDPDRPAPVDQAPSLPDDTDDTDDVEGSASATPDTPVDSDEPVTAPEPPRSCDDSVSFDELFASVAEDLRAEGDDGIFLRYISLGNRLNQGICAEDLEQDRFALIKALNSLSTEVSIALPEAIDEYETLYRIDLRDLGWDQPANVDGVEFADKWEAIIASSAYAIEFEGDDADAAKLDAATTVPLLFSDALIDTAMVGNLYYALLDIGESEDELLEQLGIDEEEQEEQAIVIKVGTSRSRLSAQDAVAERLEVENFRGFYWARYDLAADTGDQSIFANPLDFQEDAISAVFSLPNGMTGYVIFDAAGVRVADTDVIVDQTQRDGRVRNSVSCSQCHAAGLNPITDEVRAYVESNSRDFDNDTFEEVRDLFRVQSEIDAVIQRDSDQYQAALARAGIERAVGDPVSAAYVRFDREVPLDVAAGELGVTPEVLRDDLGFLIAQVDPTLGTLRAGSLRREQFDATYLAALCALSSVNDNRPLAADCAAVGQ